MISIITPCFNEEQNVETCARKLRDVMENAFPNLEYEHIFSDNSSTDKTVSLLKKLAKDDTRIKILVNSRNVGPFRNMWSAMKHSKGDAVIPFLPADLQDPAEVIPEFITKWMDSFDIVYGVRRNRQENFILKYSRKVYYKLISKFSHFEVPENVGEFLLADRSIINSVLEIDDEYPYIRGLIAQTQGKSTSIEYTWVKRKEGKSNFGFFDLLDHAINGLVSTSKIPARFALLSGFFLSLIGVLSAVISFLMVIFDVRNTINGIPTVIVGMFFFGGIQLFFLGLIGEYVLSIHNQIRKSPPMFVVDKINFEIQ